MNTSEAARESIKGRTQVMRERILAYLHYYGKGGATCDEIECGLDMKHQTASARIRELLDSGHIVSNGHTRKTRSGRAARVYIINMEDIRQLRLL